MGKAEIFWCQRRLAVAALMVLVFCAGCADSLSRSRQRDITNAIVGAAEKSGGRRSDVTVRSGISSFEAVLRGELTVDNISVTLSEPSRIAALEHALADIARRNKLTVVERSTADADRFDFAFRGMRTHTIRIAAPVTARARGANGQFSGVPRLSIIIDDLGNDHSAGEAVVSLPFPLTVSILPGLPFSAEISEKAYRHGDQVLLHLPMQAESKDIQPERSELRVGMSSQEVRSTLAGMLDSVPHVIGVNNHEGSRATSDPALMQALMPALRERGLFFIDSRTTAATVAYGEAERAGIAAASRKVFLDDVPERDAIRVQLNIAGENAMRDGFAIAIGHPHPATIAALAGDVPRLETRGIRMVFASELVH